MLMDFNKKTRINLEIATHSTLMTNYLWEQDTTEIYTKKTIKDDDGFYLIEIAKDDFAKNTISHRGELIKSLFSDFTILVEGNNDFKFIEQFLFDNNIYNVNIIRTSGKEYMEDLHNKLTNQMKIIKDKIWIIYDTDSNSNSKTPEEIKKNIKQNNEINNLTKNIIAVEPNIEKIFGLSLNKEKFDKNEIDKIINHKDFDQWIKPLKIFLASDTDEENKHNLPK